MTNPTQSWSRSDWERARQLREAGGSYQDIADDLGVAVHRVSAKFANVRHRERIESGTVKDYNSGPSPKALIERQARAVAASRRNQTAQLCGDPPPGYSALDKKNGHTPT